MVQIAPVRAGEARRLQRLHVCALQRWKPGSRLGGSTKPGAGNGGAVPLVGRRDWTRHPMRRTVTIGIVLAEVGGVSSPAGAVTTPESQEWGMTG